MDLVRTIAIDGLAATLVGGAGDVMFEGFMPVDHMDKGADTATVITVAAKTAAQIYFQFSILSKLSQVLYSNTSVEDPTNGFLMMYMSFQASPSLKKNISFLVKMYKEYIRECIIPFHLRPLPSANPDNHQ